MSAVPLVGPRAPGARRCTRGKGHGGRVRRLLCVAPARCAAFGLGLRAERKVVSRDVLENAMAQVRAPRRQPAAPAALGRPPRHAARDGVLAGAATACTTACATAASPLRRKPRWTIERLSLRACCGCCATPVCPPAPAKSCWRWCLGNLEGRRRLRKARAQAPARRSALGGAGRAKSIRASVARDCRRRGAWLGAARTRRR